MKTFTPMYYNKFKCIASNCKHNCCIGWEIDIDSQTLEYYKSVGGEFGKILLRNIEVCDNTVCFKLSENERCPFLNGDNLCDIFTNLGEKHLCQICTDHPRFRNFFDSRTEIGLGLCCEEAAKIILSNTEPFSLNVIDDDCINYEPTDHEQEFFTIREKTFDIIQNEGLALDEKSKAFLELCDASFPGKSFSFWADVLLSLEKFDEDSKKDFALLKKLDKTRENDTVSGFDKTFENLFVYFIYRHLPLVFDGYSLSQVGCFIYFCFRAVYSLCLAKKNENGKLEFDDIVETARMFSCEIEYSEENIETLLELFE